MEKAKPMDRLVCGDVGYGKTEVAIRAAFKAIMDNKQVAVLVPTTVLAEQHLRTFTERLEVFPVKIEVLSRFRSNAEQEIILKGLASGSIDICIGTHRLLQKDVIFKDLGLLIIDEEQRFGVNDKEQLKKIRRELDVLTLSATPIPRTLQMALAGVKDTSVMETPPENRLPIKTFISEYTEQLVRNAVLKELERNGQVFFVHNRVQSIDYIAEKLCNLIPEAKIVVAHGQLPEAELEKVMANFVQGGNDVLVCTTIVESGMDMPNVNTLIINQADELGLSQLYQLRGRVGRGENLAFTYLLYDKGKYLTTVAQKRLTTIFEATELGAGFSIAMKDLEIRGAGTLLGTKQSGYISAVGYSLYCQLLNEAVEEQKSKLFGLTEIRSVISHQRSPAIDLPLRAYIPESYVADIDIRLDLYQNLSELKNIKMLPEKINEYRDRFGPLPVEVKNLLYVVKIKVLAAKANVASICTKNGQVIVRLDDGKNVNKVRVRYSSREGLIVGMNQLRLDLKRLGGKWQETLEEVLESLNLPDYPPYFK
jgi:transcription-repair coupling factor (superfamily II helicase)